MSTQTPNEGTENEKTSRLEAAKMKAMATDGNIYEKIEETVLELSRTDRSRLASRLLESLDENDDFEISDAWREELNRRVAAIDEGRARMIPHDEAMARVRAKINEVKRRKAQA